MISTATLSPESFTTFGALLRYLRVRARMAQRELAIAVGYSEAQISRLEQSQRRPDYDAVLARFIPALQLEQEPPWVDRLLTLAQPETQSEARPLIPLLPNDPLLGLLATKLYRPHPRAGSVARPRLLSRLEASLRAPLSVLVAPAGSGKTTLLAAWLNQLEQRGGKATSAWLSLDTGDNDPATFLRYMVAALRTLQPSFGSETLALLDLAVLPPLPVLLTPLLNELCRWGNQLVIVLDDWHQITAPSINEILTLPIERLPTHVHLVLSTRAEPQLPLARLRAQGKLIELRAADLRFSVEESARFLRETMHLNIQEPEIIALEQRTEGWIVGLQLAALALQEQKDQSSFIANVAGGHRYIIDYLVEEVLDRLPGHLRTFLLQTSILGQLHAELCDAVLGLNQSDEVGYSSLLLSELERRSLFLIPLDGERRWYRYHHLFAEVLRERLRAGTSAEQRAELERRAKQWFAECCCRNDQVRALHAMPR